MTLSITGLTINPEIQTIKQKYDRLAKANSVNKYAKKSSKFEILSGF